MKLKPILATLFAAGLTLSAAAGHAARFGDENDTSWIYTPPGAKYRPSASQGASSVVPAARAPVRFGDENDTSWLPKPSPRS